MLKKSIFYLLPVHRRDVYGNTGYFTINNKKNNMPLILMYARIRMWTSIRLYCCLLFIFMFKRTMSWVTINTINNNNLLHGYQVVIYCSYLLSSEVNHSTDFSLLKPDGPRTNNPPPPPGRGRGRGRRLRRARRRQNLTFYADNNRLNFTY